MTQLGRDQLVDQIVDLILNAVNLRHVKKEDVTPETALVGGGLNLDSLDLLEIVVALENRFQVKIADAEAGKKIFQNIGSIADFVQNSCGSPATVA